MSRKKILITGKGSYIGTSFIKWVSRWPDQYEVEEISVRGEEWKNHDFSGYDTVLHVAGIAHIKENKKNKELYYQVNRDLVLEVATRAKKDGVKQFVFCSSMSVYGIDKGVISRSTEVNPKSNYGKSKLQAEKLVDSLRDVDYQVAIIRPPMIYGKSCKGNYRRLANFVLKVPVFPDLENRRSMVYIDNLCEFIRLLINDCSNGLFFPQNSEYVRISDLVEMIAQIHGKKIRKTMLFNPLLRLLKSSTLNKVFGDLVYEKELSLLNEKYNVLSLSDSIRATEVN
ncbi:NAD-dependent epimerase/dehydratase family protein [Paenibacillus sabinae]|uniref:Nucleoside-diphosphate-sugar epimerase n=1 Tax=Paenibacillus sabinae T27 TaxID=1268072 RepID=X4ZGD9_9BACL|nr:NAD-dependent epimerase/dehydratase family protein [Paenibacillus sabinae]AHV98596.1 nucleoside-diphosphate-sugar epimerase [Paenibacillus sabinae T27]